MAFPAGAQECEWMIHTPQKAFPFLSSLFNNSDAACRWASPDVLQVTGILGSSDPATPEAA